MTTHCSRYHLAILLTAALMGLSGCAALQPINDALAYKQGTRITDEQLEEFKKGKTTRQQIIDTLGGPQEMKTEGGKELLVYKYSQINHFGPNEGRTVTFVIKNRILAEKLVSRNNPTANPFTGE